MRINTDYTIEIDDKGVARAYKDNYLISATTLGIESALHSIWILNGSNEEHYYKLDGNSVYIEVKNDK